MYRFPYTILNMNDFHLLEPIDFDWDENNEQKILNKHNIGKLEAEQVFLNFNILVPDDDHSSAELRYGLFGQTNNEKILFIAFTLRKQKVRIISARIAKKKEREVYEKIKKDSKI